jgi:arylsulfatase A-like enzyme
MNVRGGNIAEIERLFRCGALSRRQFVAALTGVGLTASGLADLLGSQASIAEAQDTPARYLAVIVLDAFRPDYMHLAPMPALTSLMREGVAYDRAWVGQLQSYTPTGHASLSTGVMPRRHGVIGFEWRDPATGLEVYDAWAKDVLRGSLDRDLKASGTQSIPIVIKAADPSATVVALSSEKVYAADAMGGPAADYILYHGLSRTDPHKLIPAALPGHVPPRSFFDHPQLSGSWPPRHFTDWDRLAGQLALAAFGMFRPKALMINLPGADVYGHAYGGPANPQVMARVAAGLDRNIARVVEAYKAAGIFNQTLFVVAADHGMVPNTQAIDDHVVKSTVHGAGGSLYFHTGGSAADIYLHDPSRARAVAAAMASHHAVSAAYYHRRRGGQLDYVPAPGTSLSPALSDAYRYLLTTFNRPSAPDVVAVYHENTVGTKHVHTFGDHGGLSWGSQHIPLVLRGPGVKKGTTSHYPARLIDVAPTVLRLLGLPSVPMDGAVLADALVDPTAAEVSQQVAGRSQMTAYQHALMEQSARDIRWYKRRHIEPPAAAPLRP